MLQDEGVVLTGCAVKGKKIFPPEGGKVLSRERQTS